MLLAVLLASSALAAVSLFLALPSRLAAVCLVKRREGREGKRGREMGKDG
jgi:hypothetical protein